MAKFIDLTNKRFTRLLVIAQVSAKTTRWVCACDCGTIKQVAGTHLRNGKTRSCGCLQRELAPEHARRVLVPISGINNRTHCRSKTPVYYVWKTMRQRCNNPNSADYKYYGALGVTICKRWDDFANFITDMGERPEGLTLDRIDPTGNYEPGNCRWVDWMTQHRNTRRCKSRSQTTGEPAPIKTNSGDI